MSEKTKNVRYALVALLLFFCAAVQAQKVSGNVKDPTGEPVIGATVMEQGTQNGTVTDFDGNFTITLKGKSNKLVISYVGMQNKTVDVAGKSSVSVSMQDDAQMLDEVVAIGYGTVRKKDLTGAVAQVNAKQIENIPVSDVSQALQGKMSGVNVTIADGAPDAESSIRVRGGGSLSQDNSPLYIVDGFEVASISDISPSEIETIDVLKDASSTAIYGAKGANGVIIVTTKGGGDTKMPKINFNASWAWKKATKFVKVLSPYGYNRMKYEHLTATISDTQNYGYRTNVGSWDELSNWKGVAGTDYQDEIFGRTGFQQQYNVNVAGGSKILSYNVTYSHDGQDAIMRNSSLSKNNISGKLKWKANKYITVDFNIRASFQKVKGLGSGADDNESNATNSIVANAVKWNPTEVPTDDDDLENVNTGSINPLERLLITEKIVKKNKQTYNFGFTWKPWKHWSFKTEFSYNKGDNSTDQGWGARAVTSSKYAHNGRTQIRLYDEDNKGWTSKNYFTYDNKKFFGGRDNINVVAGFDIQSQKSKSTEDVYCDFPTGYTAQQALDNPNAAGFRYMRRTIEAADVNMESFYGRLNYIMKEKYMLTFTMRADGSSRFASGHRWGFFPAGAISWRLSDENFLKDSKWISNLKLRFSLGAAGNNRIPSDMYRISYDNGDISSNMPSYTYGNREDYSVNRQTVLYNPDLKWETTITRNFGIDYGFWKGRISGSIELYWNTTKDLLMKVQIPENAGYGYPTYQYQNFGKTSNKGIEISSNIVAYDTKKLTLNANFNIAFNKNKIDELSEYAGKWQDSNFGGSKIKYQDFKTEPGGALGEIWGYQMDGMYTTDDIYVDTSGKWHLRDGVTNDSYSHLGGTLYPGMPKLKDISGPEGKPDGKIDENDKVRLGNTIPTWTGGFGGDLQWKNSWGNIDATIFFNFSLGNKILNGTRLYNSFNNSNNLRYNLVNDFTDGAYYTWIDPAGNNLGRVGTSLSKTYEYNGLVGTAAVEAALADRNANATVYNPVGVTAMVITDRFVEDADFLRLQNVTVGYTFPKAWIKKIYLSNLRVYFTAYNLACITKYKGADPEVSTSKNLMCPGVDYSAYPKSRSFVAGINVAF